MIISKHWLVCLDLTKMDEILAGYTSFLTSVIKPEKITFLHIVESGPTTREIFDEFPALETQEQFNEIIGNELSNRIAGMFDEKSIDIKVIIKEGPPTNQIIEMVHTLEPDLLIMGKKVGYTGEGIVPRQILKYVPASILFIPENARYNLKSALVPVDFSKQSVNSLKTALQLVEENGAVTAQHIYKYRAQFFPYMLSGEEKKEIDNEIEKNKEKFIKNFDIPSDIKFVLTVQGEKRLADCVYELSISGQADIIVVGAKVKKLPGLIRHDFTDKMANYAFGVPVLILKNKERYQKFLDSLFKS